MNPLDLYGRLARHYGPSGWWPGDSAFEIMTGAVLTQNTAWTNVEKAILNLKSARMLTPEEIHRVPAETLAAMIRPAGYFNVKAIRLKNLAAAVMEIASGDLDLFFDRDTADLRQILLAVNGIGRETADSIICYAAQKEIFVIDAYTRRIMGRHGIIDDRADYDEIRLLFESSLPRDIGIYKDLHAWLVFVCKDYCKARRPDCDRCPLREF